MLKELTYKNYNKYSRDLYDLFIYLFKIDGFENINSLAQKKMNQICNYLKDNSAKILMFITNNSVKGFIWFYLVNNDEIHVSYLVVDKEYQEKGIGKILLNYCEEYAKKKNIKVVTLNAVNNKAKLFYKKKHYLSDNDILFTKKLYQT